MATVVNEISCETDLKQMRIFTYKWTVRNFSYCNQNVDVRSSTFKFGSKSNQALWILELSKENENVERHLSLVVASLVGRHKKFMEGQFEYTLLILNSDDEEIEYLEGVASKLSPKKYFSGKPFAVGDVLTEEDELRFVCILAVPVLDHVIQESIVTDMREDVRPQTVPVHPPPNDGDLEAFAFSSDAVLLVENKEIPVHKNILIAESFMFNKLFRRKLRKGRKNFLEITDTSYDTVFAMVAFIYTGEIKTSDKKLTRDLLVAASYYRLRELKHFCGDALLQGITVEDSCDLLILSDAHYLRYVKRETVKFIHKHLEDVQKTEGWQLIQKECSQLFSECFEKS